VKPTLTDIKSLPEVIRKNGFTYFLVQRTLKKAIYRQAYDNVSIAFEVFEIRVRGVQYSSILGKSLPPAERFPSNEDFGKTAWSFRNLQTAIKKYEEI
jgi:hypothetical protein